MPNTGISLFDQPHKFNATLTRTFNWWQNLGTDFTLVYTGVSGTPHDYVYGSSGGSSSDLNADGYNTNDLFYVPKNALDPNEIQFRAAGSRSPATQAQDLENFINASPCLKSQRGQIMERNSCRNPFTHLVDFSLARSFRRCAPSVSRCSSTSSTSATCSTRTGASCRSRPFLNSNVPLVTHVG